MNPWVDRAFVFFAICAALTMLTLAIGVIVTLVNKGHL